MSAVSQSTRRPVRVERALLASVLGAAVMFAGCGSQIADESWTGDPDPPAALEEAAAEIFSGPECLSAEEATEAVEDLLDRLGHDHWSVRWGPGIAPESCVTAALDSVQSEVRLGLGIAPRTQAVLERVREQLLETCVSREEAIELVRAALETAGVVDPDVRAGGPVGGPVDRLQEIQEHVESGCYIYSTASLTAEGGRIYYVAGP